MVAFKAPTPNTHAKQEGLVAQKLKALPHYTADINTTHPGDPAGSWQVLPRPPLQIAGVYCLQSWWSNATLISLLNQAADPLRLDLLWIMGHTSLVRMGRCLFPAASLFKDL